MLKSSLWMLGGNGLQQCLQFLIFILLARYLSPETFGHVALAAVGVEIACVVVRWGIGDVIVQRQRTSPAFIFHAFAFSFGFGFLLMLLIAGGVWFYTIFYGFGLVAQLLLLLAPMVLLQAVETVPEAIVRRDLAFKWLALRSNTAALIGGGVALALAFADMGVYALVAQRLASVLTLTVMVWIAASRTIPFYKPRRYRPRLLAGLVKAGGHMVSPGIAGIMAPRITDTLIGLFLGPVALGQYKISWRIFEFVTQLTITPLAGVAQAVFPKLVSDRAALGQAYRQMVSISAIGLLPLLAGIGLTAAEWVPLLLGEKWRAAIPVIELIGFVGVAGLVNFFQIPLLMAFRLNRLLFLQSMVRIACSTVLTSIGVSIGLLAVMGTSLLQAYGFAIFNWFVIRKTMGYPIKQSIADIVPPLCATAGMTLITLLAAHLIQCDNVGQTIFIKISFGIISYGAILFFCFRDRVRDIVAGARGLMAKKRPVLTSISRPQ